MLLVLSISWTEKSIRTTFLSGNAFNLVKIKQSYNYENMLKHLTAGKIAFLFSQYVFSSPVFRRVLLSTIQVLLLVNFKML